MVMILIVMMIVAWKEVINGDNEAIVEKPEW